VQTGPWCQGREGVEGGGQKMENGVEWAAITLCGDSVGIVDDIARESLAAKRGCPCCCLTETQQRCLGLVHKGTRERREKGSGGLAEWIKDVEVWIRLGCGGMRCHGECARWMMDAALMDVKRRRASRVSWQNFSVTDKGGSWGE
jgi:hypothetical protein